MIYQFINTFVPVSLKQIKYGLHKKLANEDSDMLFCPVQEVVVQLADHPKSQVLEGHGGSMEHLSHVQTLLQPGYLDRYFRILEGLEGLFDKPVKVLSGDVLLPNEELHHPLDNLGVGQPAPLLQLLSRELRDVFREVETAIFCIAGEQHLCTLLYNHEKNQKVIM